MVKKVFWIRWMNRTRFKDKNGRLNINSTPGEHDEAEVRRKFESYTKSGYACQLKCADVVRVEAFNFKNPKKPAYAELRENEQVLDENYRWMLRIKEDKIRRLTQQKEAHQKAIKEIDEQLAELTKEN